MQGHESGAITPTPDSSPLLAGDERTSIPLDIAPATNGVLDSSLGLRNDISQAYNSGAVDVLPIIQTVYQTDPNQPVPTRIQVTLAWDGTTRSPVIFSTAGHGRAAPSASPIRSRSGGTSRRSTARSCSPASSSPTGRRRRSITTCRVPSLDHRRSARDGRPRSPRLPDVTRSPRAGLFGVHAVQFGSTPKAREKADPTMSRPDLATPRDAPGLTASPRQDIEPISVDAGPCAGAR